MITRRCLKVWSKRHRDRVPGRPVQLAFILPGVRVPKAAPLLLPAQRKDPGSAKEHTLHDAVGTPQRWHWLAASPPPGTTHLTWSIPRRPGSRGPNRRIAVVGGGIGRRAAPVFPPPQGLSPLYTPTPADPSEPEPTPSARLSTPRRCCACG